MIGLSNILFLALKITTFMNVLFSDFFIPGEEDAVCWYNTIVTIWYCVLMWRCVLMSHAYVEPSQKCKSEQKNKGSVYCLTATQLKSEQQLRGRGKFVDTLLTLIYVCYSIFNEILIGSKECCKSNSLSDNPLY